MDRKTQLEFKLRAFEHFQAGVLHKDHLIRFDFHGVADDGRDVVTGRYMFLIPKEASPPELICALREAIQHIEKWWNKYGESKKGLKGATEC